MSINHTFFTLHSSPRLRPITNRILYRSSPVNCWVYLLSTAAFGANKRSEWPQIVAILAANTASRTPDFRINITDLPTYLLNLQTDKVVHSLMIFISTIRKFVVFHIIITITYLLLQCHIAEFFLFALVVSWKRLQPNQCSRWRLKGSMASQWS